MIKKTYGFFPFLFIILVLTGCSFDSLLQKDTINKDEDCLTIGNYLTINNLDDSFTLLDHKETLAANGIYYASFGIGDSQDYENNNGEIINLYDAQLYLLLGETKSENTAKKKKDDWILAAKENYDILEEEKLYDNEPSYSLLSYHHKNTDNPHTKGISAFCVFGNNALCIELTSKKDFEEDLKTLLMNFLENLSYHYNEE